MHCSKQWRFSQLCDMAVDGDFSKGISEILEFVHTTFIWDIQNNYLFLAGHKREQFDRIMENAEHELPGWQVTKLSFSPETDFNYARV